MSSHKYSIRRRARLGGFTLLEVLVAMALFSLMMVAASGIFSGGVLSYKDNVRVEQNLENAQFIMNDMMKQLRTSTIINPTGNPATNTNPVSIRFFEHSQSKCIAYRVHTGSPNYLEKSVGSATDESTCGSSPGLNTWTRVTTGDVTMKLQIISSSSAPKRIGMVTIVFVVKGEGASQVQPVTLQSSVSLRDYTYVGL